MPVKLIFGRKIKYRMFVFWGNLAPKGKRKCWLIKFNGLMDI